jgi:hypothetical protein
MGLLAILIGIAVYVVGAYGLYSMAKNRGEENSWMAWVPIANIHLIGKMVGEMTLFGQHFGNLALIAPAVSVGLIVVSFIPLIGGLLSLAGTIFVLCVIYSLIRQYREDTGTCVVFTIFNFIGFFLLRNDPVIRS